MTVTLVNVPDVEIVSTGTYQLASGEATFTEQMLADAVEAAQDPTVTTPRLKIGHTDPRFAAAIASGDLDGEPAFGVVGNLRLSDDRQTILGDYTNVPDWLADTLPSSYPGRSIEGGFNFTAASGRKYSFVITACALLGVTWPGVGTLEDLQEVLTQNGEAPELGEMEQGEITEPVMARIRRPADAISAAREAIAGMDVGDVRMQFYSACETGQVPAVDGIGPQLWWWVRSIRVEDGGDLNLIVDDDEGHLLQIPFTVEGQTVSYGDPVQVAEQFVPVAAAAGPGPRVIASWPVRAARPSTPTEVTTMRLNGVDVEAGPLRTSLGLAEDATDAQIYAALGLPEDGGEGNAPTTTAAAPAAGETAPATAPVAEPVAAGTPALPEGMQLVDSETLATLSAGAAAAQTLAAERAAERREAAITAAIRSGKIAAGSRASWVTRHERDPDGTLTMLTASVEAGGLPEGLVPVGGREYGHAGDGEAQDAGADSVHDDYMARHFPQNHAKLHARRGAGLRVRQEA